MTLVYVAAAYALVNVAAGFMSPHELLPTFVVLAPILLGLAVVSAQTVNAPRPFHWWAVAGLGGFLLAAGAMSHFALRWS
jgi:hypothetical protein